MNFSFCFFFFVLWMVLNACCDVCRRGVSQCSKNVTADFNGKWSGNIWNLTGKLIDVTNLSPYLCVPASDG